MIGENEVINIEDKELSKSISLSIITSFTDKEKAILAKELENNNIDYINAAADVENFVKAFKPVYYYDALKNVDTEYVLIIDGYDTVLNSIDEMPSCLEHYGKDMLYSSWKNHFPTYFDVDFSVPEDNERKYLNSGVFFGKTSEAKKFYKALSDYINAEYEDSDHWLKDFEQYWLYKFITENKSVLTKLGIDYDEVLASNRSLTDVKEQS
jgi:hypothetical protein